MHQFSNKRLTIDRVREILDGREQLALSKEAAGQIKRSREYLDKKVEEASKPIYGVTTGFGSLYKHSISTSDLEQLQENLVMSHACGTGAEVPEEIVRLILLLKIQSLAYGKSAVQLSTVQRLIEFYNRGIHPVIYEQGSLGASGDLAPLAHLSLTLIGKGEVSFEGKRTTAEKVHQQLELQPVSLRSKEGLALLNGTQFMSAYGVWALMHVKKLIRLADLIAALSLDAFDGRLEPFHELPHAVRAHPGQVETAAFFRKILKDSKLIARKKEHIQDPYSFRCIPQVHGATKDAIKYVHEVMEREINSVTDNPTVFADEDEIISAGNFHGQPLALALDFLAIALSELGSISERRTYLLVSGERGLPNYLVANQGLNSGFMIPQYTAASIASQNKQLCTPASIDTITSSNGQEDHVSMGANAATKAYRVVENLYTILAIELFTAAQALEFRKPQKSSGPIETFVHEFRKSVPFITNDKIMHTEIKNSVGFMKDFDQWELLE